MTRVATGAVAAILDKLEPEAKAGWEDEALNLSEAIACSAAITNRATARATADAQTIKLAELAETTPAAVDRVPGETRDRYALENPIP